ncbi:MAG: NAD(P)-dependent oxidoreductase [Caldilineaceae bacterium]|jgi:nucleoside-diphosphate-sugar epimerase|nr:NAD(P)-dependent oxidoreductase [Caldilineaceae bacterium]
MNQSSILITGALGCIGAWTVRQLVRAGAAVSILDLSDDAQRMRLIMSDDEIGRIRFLRGDITDPAAVEAAFRASAAEQVIHLAALQIPACKANPVLGARVNVVGMVNLFEAAHKAGIRHVVYASSIAVYGLAEEYPPGPVSADAMLRPRTLYGVFKQADEGIANVYWHDHGISSIGLRPYVVYGAGRDQGMTSSPTKAMLAAAAGQPYHIAYGGRCDMQYAADVAAALIQALHTPGAGAAVYNLRGSVVRMAEVVAAIEAAAPARRGQITYEEQRLPYPEEWDDRAAQAALGPLPTTPLYEGVAETIGIFGAALASGRIVL